MFARLDVHATNKGIFIKRKSYAKVMCYVLSQELYFLAEEVQ